MKKLFLILMLTIAFVALFFIVVLGQPRGGLKILVGAKREKLMSWKEKGG